jgi:hyperosmotically inducible periplasmic protein
VALYRLLYIAMFVAVAGCATDTKEQRSAGEFTDDAALTAKVKTAIATDVGARTAAAVNVETYRGVIQLTGFVDSEDQVSKAVTAAKKVSGVRSVKNDIRIKKGN